MENAILIGIGLAVIYQGYKLVKDQRKLRKEMSDLEKANSDLNIEFSAMEGTGITQVKKQYPDLELKDDFREKVEPHSIAKGMNDPSEMQEVAFRLDEK